MSASFLLLVKIYHNLPARGSSLSTLIMSLISLWSEVMMIKIVDCSSWSLSCDLCTINNLIVHDCDQWSVILTMVSHHPSSVSAPVSPVSGAVSDPSWAELCFLCHICCSTVISNSLQNIIQSPLAVLAISGDFITTVAPVSVVGSFLSQQFNNIIGGNMRSWAYDREDMKTWLHTLPTTDW